MEKKTSGVGGGRREGEERGGGSGLSKTWRRIRSEGREAEGWKKREGSRGEGVTA